MEVAQSAFVPGDLLQIILSLISFEIVYFMRKKKKKRKEELNGFKIRYGKSI